MGDRRRFWFFEAFLKVFFYNLYSNIWWNGFQGLLLDSNCYSNLCMKINVTWSGFNGSMEYLPQKLFAWLISIIYRISPNYFLWNRIYFKYMYIYDSILKVQRLCYCIWMQNRLNCFPKYLWNSALKFNPTSFSFQDMHYLFSWSYLSIYFYFQLIVLLIFCLITQWFTKLSKTFKEQNQKPLSICRALKFSNYNISRIKPLFEQVDLRTTKILRLYHSAT